MSAVIEVIDRSDEGAGPTVQPSWDTAWVIGTDLGIGACGDWFLADPELEPHNAGGLRALDPLGTAILLQLGTNKRAPEGIEVDPGNEGGWHGDTFDIDNAAHEEEIGSLLYTLERAALTDETVKMAEYFAKSALQCLIRQGAASHIEVEAETDSAKGWLILAIRVYVERDDNPYDIRVPAFKI